MRIRRGSVELPGAIAHRLRMRFASTLFFLAMMSCLSAAEPVRLAVAGLKHGHVGWILGREAKGDIELVGIAESDATLAKAHCKRFGLDEALVYPDLEAMLDATKPDAVVAFGSIDEHVNVVRACAPRGIHVMVEKPLAVSVSDAKEIEKLAGEHGIQVLTNYETTWYPTVDEAKKIVADGRIGTIRKMVAHDGHEGPKEIGCGPEFLGWLLGSEAQGGGALIDFGCYGANLMTWLMNGERPTSVVAVTQKLKTDPAYVNVDDEATIVLEYPTAQGVIQASWNWPYSRKDLEIYGRKGAVFADDAKTLRVRVDGKSTSTDKERESPFDDCFAYLAAVVRGEVDPADSPSSLPINVTVVEILDAARRSAESGRAVKLQ